MRTDLGMEYGQALKPSVIFFSGFGEVLSDLGSWMDSRVVNYTAATLKSESKYEKVTRVWLQ